MAELCSSSSTSTADASPPAGNRHPKAEHTFPAGSWQSGWKNAPRWAQPLAYALFIPSCLKLLTSHLRQDLVFLQEVWVNADAVRITKQAARGRLQHAHHFVSGLFGSGLVVLSRYPIEQVHCYFLPDYFFTSEACLCGMDGLACSRSQLSR